MCRCPNVHVGIDDIDDDLPPPSQLGDAPDLWGPRVFSSSSGDEEDGGQHPQQDHRHIAVFRTLLLTLIQTVTLILIRVLQLKKGLIYSLSVI